MTVIKVIVDKMPDGCDSCPLNFSNESNSYCVPLITEQHAMESLKKAQLTHSMYYFRRHDCPLVVE